MPISPARLAAFHVLPSVTPKVLRLALEHERLNSLSSWTTAELVSWGIDRQRAERVVADLPYLNEHKAAAVLEEQRVVILRRSQAEYPAHLQAIAQPPEVLYIRGTIAALNQPGLAIVGTRRSSAYGRRQTEIVTEHLAQAGLSIISGLAYGIDAAAHRTALKAGGTTVAIMGTGIDQIYPWDHRALAEDIITKNGAIVTELPLGAAPERYHFPQRNRIIAGLARAVWLVEADERSGALITMKYGLEENRDLYALPGDAHRPTSTGPLNWLRLGAAVGAEWLDFRATFPALTGNQTTPPSAPSVSADERIVLDRLGPTDSRHIDEIAEACRLEASVIAATLSLLEVRGLVRHHGDMRYTRLT